MVKDGVTKLEEFAQLIHAHDITYQYSDDPRAWKRGDEQRQALLELAQHLSRTEALVIVELTAKAKLDAAVLDDHYIERFMADLDRRRV